jgi:hypothetical protein
VKTRILHTRFWQDEFVSRLSHKEKLAFVYFLTNDKVSLTGMYELPDRYICVDLDITQKELDGIKEKFSGKIDFIDGWVKIQKHDSYNSFQKGKAGIARDRELTDIPDKVKVYRRGIDTSIDTSMDTRSDTPNNHNHNHKDNPKGKDKGESEGKKKPYSKLDDLTETDFEEIAEHYSKQLGGEIPVGFVRSKYDDLVNYCQSKGKKYDNYRATLMNWVKRDALQIIEKNHDRSSDIVL